MYSIDSHTADNSTCSSIINLRLFSVFPRLLLQEEDQLRSNVVMLLIMGVGLQVYLQPKFL